MTVVAVTVDDAAVQATLARLRDAAQNLRPALDAVGMSIASRMRATFEQQADPWGKSWQGLKASTLRKRRKAGKGAQILRDTGRLMNSIAHTAGDSEVVIGSTNVEYAAIHQFGGAIQRKGRAGSVRLRTDARGNLIRQKGYGNLAVFAKQRHKRAVGRDYQGRDYVIPIVARSFAPLRGGRADLPADWAGEAVGLITKHLREAVQ